MSFPDVERRISLEEFTDVLREAKRCVAQGILRSVKPVNAAFALDDLSDVPDEGPWPDLVEAYFEDARGQRYRLVVETYHGSGGTWSRV